MIPKQVIESIEAVIKTGKDAIVKKERGKWVVLESGRRLVYKEPKSARLHVLSARFALLAHEITL